MKTQFSFRIIFTGVAVGLLSACATYAPAGGPLVGTWTNSLGTVWTIKADNTFDVVNPKRHIWGNITVADRKSTRLNSSHTVISYAVFCLKKKKHKRH